MRVDVADVGGALKDLAFADLDGDGGDELYVVSESSRELIVLKRESDNQVAVTARSPLPGKPRSILPIENGAGKRLVVSMDQPPSLTFVEKTSGKPLNVESVFELFDEPIRSYFADFTLDGIGDIITLSTYDGELMVFAGNADGSFRDGVLLALGRDTADLAFVDTNGDGRVEVLAVVRTSDRLSSYRIVSGKFLFPLYGWTAGREPVSVAAGDFDGDGFIDAATADREGGTVTLLRSYDSTTFHNPQAIPVMSNPTQVLFRDLNGDGVAELLVAGESGNSILVFQYPGIENPVRFDTIAKPSMTATGDMNGDDAFDLAAIGPKETAVTIYLSKGGVGVADWILYE